MGEWAGYAMSGFNDVPGRWAEMAEKAEIETEREREADKFMQQLRTASASVGGFDLGQGQAYDVATREELARQRLVNGGIFSEDSVEAADPNAYKSGVSFDAESWLGLDGSNLEGLDLNVFDNPLPENYVANSFDTALDEVSSWRFGSGLETNWSDNSGHVYKNQNAYNQLILDKLANSSDISPRVFKSLIAKESSFIEDAGEGGSYVGLTQVGEPEAEKHGLVVNGAQDQRLIPERAIHAGVEEMREKMRSINNYLNNHKIYDQYSDSERLELYLSAYNAGQGTIRTAMSTARGLGITAPTLDDLTKGGQQSHLWNAIPESWGRDAKLNEISNYAPDIISRSKQQ